MKPKNLFGQTFGWLTAVMPIGKTRWGNIIWLVHCICGEDVALPTGEFVGGNTRSCGCFHKTVVTDNRYGRKHGHSPKGEPSSPTHISWAAMKQRCLDPNATGYEYYGGRGIRICDAWITDFRAFLGYMGERPIGTTLDRVDSDGNYEPGNCRWATPKEQARNRRKVKI